MHVYSTADGVPYEVVVVALTSAGMGVQNDLSVFFAKELPPSVPVDASSVIIIILSDNSLNITWEGLSLIEARGFPQYNVTLILLSTNNRRKRQLSLISVLTTDTFAVIGGLASGASYSPAIGVRSMGADIQTFNVTDDIPPGVTIIIFYVYTSLSTVFYIHRTNTGNRIVKLNVRYVMHLIACIYVGY